MYDLLLLLLAITFYDYVFYIMFLINIYGLCEIFYGYLLTFIKVKFKT